MSNKDIFSERERGLEEEYFMRKERELIEKLRQKNSAENAQQQMAAATGIQDTEVVEALQELGYTPDTVMLLHLVPLIQVAWASGDVSDKERELILHAARSRGVGIGIGSTAETQLNEWLTKKPADAFFENTLRAIRIFIEAQPAGQRREARQDLLSYSRSIAQASGGFLGIGTISGDEEVALEAIANIIAKNNPDAAEQIIGE
ncbi:MAG: TerB family tellurite resistance protein [Acidobacteria bacterium]|nr:TerB family tellurite resistance protein [Acidobacteriota bacterium]